jgi:hypothetical protein
MSGLKTGVVVSLTASHVSEHQKLRKVVSYLCVLHLLPSTPPKSPRPTLFPEPSEWSQQSPVPHPLKDPLWFNWMNGIHPTKLILGSLLPIPNHLNASTYLLRSNPVHHEGWMVSGQETVFLLGSHVLANHGGLAQFFNLFFYLPTNNSTRGLN